MSVRKSNTGARRRTKLGLALEESAKEILAHVKGERRLPTRRIVLLEEVDVKRNRSQVGMSQAEFARAFYINPRTLQEWEQGRRKPDATTRAYLAVRRYWTHWRRELETSAPLCPPGVIQPQSQRRTRIENQECYRNSQAPVSVEHSRKQRAGGCDRDRGQGQLI